MEESKKEAAIAFERRIEEAFELIGYHVETAHGVGDKGFDFTIHGYQFPIEISAIVEVKYFEHSMVPASLVLEMKQLADKCRVDKAIIVTTLGFTESAHRIASETPEKIILLNEVELIEKIPRKNLGQVYQPFLNSTYISSSINNYFQERKPDYERLIEKLPKNELLNFIFKSSSAKEIRELLIERLPKEFLFSSIKNELEIGEVKRIISEETTKRPLPPIAKKKSIEELYKKAIDLKDDPNQKGDLFEAVVRQIFELVPNIKHIGSNVDNGIEEIDIQFRNHNHESVWYDFDSVIYIECKNWTKPVGSKEIDNFKAKLERSGLKNGILVALNGVTGSPAKLEGAWGALKMYLQTGFRIVILDRDDLESIFRCADIAETIDNKFVLLYKLGSGKDT